MNVGDPELDELLSPLRDGPVSLSSVDTERARRARLMPAVRRAAREVPGRIAQRDRQRRLKRGVVATVALAAAAVMGMFVRASEPLVGALASEQASARVRVESHGAEPIAWHPDGASARMIDDADELSTAGELRAREGARAALITQAGVEVQVLPRSRVRVLVRKGSERRPDALALLEGEVHCRVPPLLKGDSFVVKTPSTRVVVHGTEFNVRVREDGESCVSVRDGLVEVQRPGGSIWLGPGSDWGCEDVARVAASAPTPVAEARPSRVERREALRTAKVDRRAVRRAVTKRADVGSRSAREGVADKAPARRARRAKDGTLAAETKLLEQALRAEQQGERGRASSLFARLIASYPDSPLVPEARAGLSRLH